MLARSTALTNGKAMKGIGFLLIFLIFVYFGGLFGLYVLNKSTKDSKEELQTEVTRLCEQAYFEGQRDALIGDIRIKCDEEYNCWRWAKSPWNNGQAPILDISGIPDGE